MTSVTRSPRASRGRPRAGFTLVEIMVALGVFALVAVSAYGRMGGIVDQQRLLEERMLATWVAENRITALELEQAEDGTLPTPGEREDRVSLGDRDWLVRSRIGRAPNAALARLQVEVFLLIDERDPSSVVTLVRDVGPQ